LSICHQVIDARKLALEKGEPTVPKFPSAVDLHKINAEVKPSQQWFYPLSVRQQALRDLDNAWKRSSKLKKW